MAVLKSNGRQARAGTNLSVGDTLVIKFGRSIVTYEVVQLNDTTKKEDAERMYKVIKKKKLKKKPNFNRK